MPSTMIAQCPRSRAALPLPVLALLIGGCESLPVLEGRLRGRQSEVSLADVHGGLAGDLPPGVPLVAAPDANQSLVEGANQSHGQDSEPSLDQVGREQASGRVYELEAPLRQKSKVTLTLLELFLLGILGIDRCYMGQCGLGVIKGLTLGCLGIWMVMDWVVVMLNALTQESSIDNLGLRAVFGPGELVPSLWIAVTGIIVIFLLTLLGIYLATRSRMFFSQGSDAMEASGAKGADGWREVYESLKPGESGVPVSAIRRALRDRRWSESDIRRATPTEKPVTYDRFKAIMTADS